MNQQPTNNYRMYAELGIKRLLAEASEMHQDLNINTNIQGHL